MESGAAMTEAPKWMAEVPSPLSPDEYSAVAPFPGEWSPANHDDLLPSIERLGVPVFDDDGRVNHIKSLTGGQTARLLEWVYLTLDGDFFNVRTGEQISRASFDVSMSVYTPGVQFDGEEKPKRFPPSKTLLDFLRGRSVYSTMYRPDADAMIFEHDERLWVNSYLPGSVPEADPHWRDHDAWRIVRDHIHNIFPEGAEIIIKWLAHNVQFPGVKILWAPVLVGIEGDGKTTIARKALQAAMGRHVEDASTEELFSDFSEWAAGACVRVLEEIRIDGERRTAVMDKLKPKITNASVRIVPKGKRGREVVNVTNYIACTNHLDALAITPGDRRYGVWKTRFSDRQEMLAERPEAEWRCYWRRLHGAIDGHLGVIRGWLLEVDLSDFDRNAAPPVTDAKLRMLEAARTSSDFAVREAIDIGGFGVAPDVLATDCLCKRIKEIGDVPPRSSALSKILIDAGWTRHDGQIKWKGEPRRLYFRADRFAGLHGTDLARALRARLDESDRDRDRDHLEDPYGGTWI